MQLSTNDGRDKKSVTPRHSYQSLRQLKWKIYTNNHKLRHVNKFSFLSHWSWLNNYVSTTYESSCHIYQWWVKLHSAKAYFHKFMKKLVIKQNGYLSISTCRLCLFCIIYSWNAVDLGIGGGSIFDRNVWNSFILDLICYKIWWTKICNVYFHSKFLERMLPNM